jgi:hypothetical protein
MTITEVHRELNTDRYTPEGLRWIIMFMSCTNPDAFRDATRELNAHMVQHPDSRKTLTVQPITNGDRCCTDGLVCCCNIRTCTCTCAGCYCG